MRDDHEYGNSSWLSTYRFKRQDHHSGATIFTRLFGLVALGMFCGTSPALAGEAAKLNGADTAWMLMSTALVLMMTIPGLMLFYSGSVRRKNALSMVIQSFAVCCLATLVFTLGQRRR